MWQLLTKKGSSKHVGMGSSFKDRAATKPTVIVNWISGSRDKSFLVLRVERIMLMPCLCEEPNSYVVSYLHLVWLAHVSHLDLYSGVLITLALGKLTQIWRNLPRRCGRPCSGAATQRPFFLETQSIIYMHVCMYSNVCWRLERRCFNYWENHYMCFAIHENVVCH